MGDYKDWSNMTIRDIEYKLLRLMDKLYPSGKVKVIFDPITKDYHPHISSYNEGYRGGELWGTDDKLTSVTTYLIDMFYLDCSVSLWKGIETYDIWDCEFTLKSIDSCLNSNDDCTYVWAYFNCTPITFLGNLIEMQANYTLPSR